MTTTLSAEYCIIGSGPAGTIVASNLLGAGAKSVIMVEAGDHVSMRNHAAWERYVALQTDPFETTYDRLDDFSNLGTYEYPLVGGRLWARGGAGLIWTGHAFRLKPEDFRLYSSTGRGVDWPIDYQELEAYYEIAEHTLQVAGAASDHGHPPRRSAFPLSPFPYSEEDGAYLEAMAGLGISFQHNCIARNSTALGSSPECTLLGTCGYCPTGGRFTTDQLLDELEANPEFTLLTRTSGLRFIFAEKYRAASLEVLIQQTGQTQNIEADRFIICGGGIESPKLLLSSVTEHWKKGIGNDTGLVGNFFTEHPIVICRGIPRTTDRARLEYPAFNTACSRHFDSIQCQADGKFIVEVVGSRAYRPPMMTNEMALREDLLASYCALGVLVELPSIQSNRVALGRGGTARGLPTTELTFTIDASSIRTIDNATRATSDILRSMGCTDVTTDPRIRWGRHHMGTCRMSTKPSTGVVDPDLRVHGTENLYVCSSAVFPSAGAANPTLTIAALAHRLAAHLTSNVAHHYQ